MSRLVASKALRVLGLILFCALVAIVVTWELTPKLSTHLDRSTQDTLVHYWDSWWIGQALARGMNPYACDALFYPQGVSLVTHNLVWFNALFAAIFSPFLGGIAAYNLSILVSITLCGITAFYLAYQLTGNPYAALVAAVIYEAWPFRISHLGHPNILSTQWIPLFLLALVRLRQTLRWRTALAAGVWFALAAYTRWQLMIGAALMGGIYSATAILATRERRLALLQRLAMGALLAAILLLPAIAMLIQNSALPDIEVHLLRPDDAQRTQTDLAAYLVPWYRHPVYGELFTSTYERFYATAARPMYPTYIGWIALVLVILGLRAPLAKTAPWIIMGLTLVLLALGPLVRINGQLYPHLPTLSQFVAPLKVFELMRFPRRYNMFLALPMSILAAYGVQVILDRWPRASRLQVLLFTLALCAWIAFDYLGTPLSLGAVADRLSPGLAVLAEDEGQGAVLNVPIGYQWAKDYMFEQTVHGHPIVQGHISRIPESLNRVGDYLPAAVPFAANTEEQQPPPTLLDDEARLAEAGVDYVVLHKDELAPETIAAWRQAFGRAPYFEDERLLLYHTP